MIPSADTSSHNNMIRRTGQFTLFFKKCAFSQHTACRMTVDDREFHSALHYMLYEKASEYAVLEPIT